MSSHVFKSYIVSYDLPAVFIYETKTITHESQQQQKQETIYKSKFGLYYI